MTATLDRPRKRTKHGVYHPDGYAPPLAGEEWDKLAPRLSEICALPKGTVDPLDHQQACWLLQSGVGRTTGAILEAQRLVAKYFPAESAVEANGRGEGTADNAKGAEKKARKEVRDFGGQTLSRITLADCVRHPDNRVPTEAAVAALAASIEKEGLLEPIVVRRAAGQWQILSGETRVLALRKLGRKGEIDAHVVQCDDARALELLAVYNAKRKDLNPIEKARLLARLRQPIEAGGGGLTQAQAAAVYELSAPNAANLERLLELPKLWQDRVASGELPWTWAREMLPYTAVLAVPTVAKQLEEEWRERETAADTGVSMFLSRQGIADSLPQLIHNECRRLDEPQYCQGATHLLKVDAGDPAIRQELGLVELSLPVGKKGKTETVQMATNAAAFDERLKRQAAQKTKAAAEKAGADPKGTYPFESSR